MTVTPLARAASAAARRFGLRPLVLCRMSRSRFVHQRLDLAGVRPSRSQVVAGRRQQATSVPSATAAYAPRRGCSWL